MSVPQQGCIIPLLVAIAVTRSQSKLTFMEESVKHFWPKSSKHYMREYFLIQHCTPIQSSSENLDNLAVMKLSRSNDAVSEAHGATAPYFVLVFPFNLSPVYSVCILKLIFQHIVIGYCRCLSMIKAIKGDEVYQPVSQDSRWWKRKSICSKQCDNKLKTFLYTVCQIVSTLSKQWAGVCITKTVFLSHDAELFLSHRWVGRLPQVKEGDNLL